jgi:hypothetical protein
MLVVCREASDRDEGKAMIVNAGAKRASKTHRESQMTTFTPARLRELADDMSPVPGVICVDHKIGKNVVAALRFAADELQAERAAHEETKRRLDKVRDALRIMGSCSVCDGGITLGYQTRHEDCPHDPDDDRDPIDLDEVLQEAWGTAGGLP